MPILIDTNILLRARDVNTAGHADSVKLLLSLHDRPAHPLAVCAQVLIELWTIATRPVDVNGHGMTPAEAASQLDDVTRVPPRLHEPPDVAALRREVVRETPVEGKVAHDARLVAFMRARGIGRIITLNPRHLARFLGVTCHSRAEAIALGLVDSER